MAEQIKTEQVSFRGISQSWNHKVSADLDRIEDIHQIRISLVDLTRKMDTSDSTRQAALIEIIHSLASLEKAADHIRAAA